MPRSPMAPAARWRGILNAGIVMSSSPDSQPGGKEARGVPFMSWQSDILRLMPPPADPFVPEGNWERAERRLGTRLPADYRWFVETYGVGTVCGYVWVDPPFIDRDDGFLRYSAGLALDNYRSF